GPVGSEPTPRVRGGGPGEERRRGPNHDRRDEKYTAGDDESEHAKPREGRMRETPDPARERLDQLEEEGDEQGSPANAYLEPAIRASRGREPLDAKPDAPAADREPCHEGSKHRDAGELPHPHHEAGERR